MKTSLILLVLLPLSIFANELSWVDEQVNAIKPNRDGISDSKISKLRSPFVYLKKNLPKGAKAPKRTSRVQRPIKSYKSVNISRTKNVRSAKRSIKINNSTFTLSAIINSSALINGKWYKLGDKLRRYKIVNVAKTSITLSKNNRTTVLSIKSSTNKLKFK